MARWAVVRVAADDGMTAQAVAARAFAPITMTVDMNPPASGPEWELRVQDRTEAELVSVLSSSGLSVLASKQVLDPPLLPELDSLG